VLDPASDAAKRVESATQLDLAVAAWVHRCQSFQQPAACERPQFAAKRFGRRDDQVAKLAERGSTSIDGAVTGGHQSPQRLPFAAGTRLRRPLLRKHETRGTDRVEGVGFAARAAFSPQPPDLEDGLATSREEAGQAGAEGAAALDREGTPTRRVLAGQFKRTSITGPARDDRRLEHDSAGADLDDREEHRRQPDNSPRRDTAHSQFRTVAWDHRSRDVSDATVAPGLAPVAVSVSCGENRSAVGEIRYAHSGGIAIAYQVVGVGEVDLVFVPDYVSNLVYGWESRYYRGFYERLARSFRLILFDKRGTGLSDHGPHFAALETRMEDLRAVLDAAGSTDAVVFGAHEGCGMAALYAATYPERTRALVLFHPLARRLGTEEREVQEHLSELRAGWGEQEWCDELLRMGCPTLYASEDDRRWFANWLRVSASPAVAYALNRAFFETDLRVVLPAVRVPTLVLYRQVQEVEGDPMPLDVEREALDVAARIPGAHAMRVSGSDYFGLFLSLDIADEIERFVAGEEAPAVPETILATLMFTDLVGSTERASALGDRRWRELLSEHHAAVRRELARFRGQERDTAGDGFFATFDGPARAIRAGEAIVADVEALDLGVRIGIHVGECELHDGKPAGTAVNIGSRVAAIAKPGEILVTGTVHDLVAGAGLTFDERGEHNLKGIPGLWRLYAYRAAVA
jgi:class 3 adenylate cyclase/pimeloyl-ACP methyl ester carboxylesterase